MLWHSGFPVPVNGASTGAIVARPDRVAGVDLVLPENLQGWYDGRTTITLPSGRRVTPPANTYLKYNPDGSLTLCFADQKPANAPDGNWLPTPKGKDYRLTFRFYGPKGGVTDGSYYPPPVTKQT